MGDDDADPTTVDEEVWYVPYKFYRLKKISAYMPADGTTMPGFNVRFLVKSSHCDLQGVCGWPPIDHTFGNTGVGYTPQSPLPVFTSSNEIVQIATCVDTSSTDGKADFESFHLKIIN